MKPAGQVKHPVEPPALEHVQRPRVRQVRLNHAKSPAKRPHLPHLFESIASTHAHQIGSKPPGKPSGHDPTQRAGHAGDQVGPTYN